MKRKTALKKLMAAALVGVLSTNMLTGCGTKEAATGEEDKTVNEEVKSEEYLRTEKNVEMVQTYVSQLISDPKNNPVDFSKGGFIWDTETKSDSWRYFNGVMIDSFLQLDAKAYMEYVEKFYNDNISENGVVKDYIQEELDSVPAALGLFYLLDSEQAEKYQTAINYVYQQLENQTSYVECGGNYLHKPSWKKWNIGLDGLYMAQPFLIRCANAIDEGKLILKGKDGQAVMSETIYEAVFQRMNWVAENMYDEASKLYHHGWNVENNSGNGHFWGRGIGWYAVALVDVIEGMPQGEYKEQLIQQLPKLFDGMLQYQDEETGLWYNVVNQPTLEKNCLETSVSAMMAYSLMKAYNNGWVTDTIYKDAGLKAFNGTVETKMTEVDGKYSVIDTYQKSGVETIDEGYVKNNYVADEGKGIGVLIMSAALALETVQH